MSTRNELFNTASSEAGLSQKPSTDGEVFNLLDGHTTIMPNSLGTSQGSNNSVYNTNADNTIAATPSNPHGTLLRNVNIASLEPAVATSTTLTDVNSETINGTTLTASISFANLTIATATYSGTYVQTLPQLSSNGIVSSVAVQSIHTAASSASAAFTASVGTTGTVGWTFSGNSIIWSNAGYNTMAAASAASKIPTSGQTYYLDITYVDTIANTTQGNVERGNLAALSVGQGVQDAWVGNNVFGKPVYGAPEVQITNFSGTRDSLSMPANRNIKNSTTLIPNVGSRMYRA